MSKFVDLDNLARYDEKIKEFVNNETPTQLSQLQGDSTHRTVTDTEKSTWNNKSNFSGNYNDLTNKPVTIDLLHYKGHVATVEDLPSTGQPSGQKTAFDSWIATFTDSMVNQNATYAVAKATSVLGNMQYIFGRFENSTGSGANNYRAVLTNYPEIIEKIYVASENYAEGTSSPGSAPTLGLLYINASVEKPAYLISNSQYTDANIYSVIEYDDGTQEISGARTQLLITKPGWFYMGYMYYPIVGNLPQEVKWAPHWTDHSETYYKANSSGAIVATQMPNNTMAQSITVTMNTFRYTYNEGYKFLKFKNTVGVASFVDNTTDVVENDTYTVGDNNEIYRANGIPQWEHWTQQDYTRLNNQIYNNRRIDPSTLINDNTYKVNEFITIDINEMEKGTVYDLPTGSFRRIGGAFDGTINLQLAIANPVFNLGFEYTLSLPNSSQRYYKIPNSSYYTLEVNAIRLLSDADIAAMVDDETKNLVEFNAFIVKGSNSTNLGNVVLQKGYITIKRTTVDNVPNFTLVYQLANARTEIPVANYYTSDTLLTTTTGYDATKTQVLKNVNGVLQWVDESV